MIHRRREVLAGLLLSITACASMTRISGLTNSNVHNPIPRSASFALQQAGGDEFMAPKIERLLTTVLRQKGLEPATTAPDLKVFYAFDVVSAGEVSTARTSVYSAPQTATVTDTYTGADIETSGGTSTATTTVDTTKLYQKTIAVMIADARTGEKIWEAQTTEEGWCNQIFVTAPDILLLMFESFPNDVTNVRRAVQASDPNLKRLQAVFPPDTDWTCQ